MALLDSIVSGLSADSDGLGGSSSGEALAEGGGERLGEGGGGGGGGAPLRELCAALCGEWLEWAQRQRLGTEEGGARAISATRCRV